MREQSLMLRLEKNSGQRNYTTESDIDSLLVDISHHVQDMLNVRLGSVKGLSDFGMPDFNDVVKEFPDAITRIRGEIQRFIERYEPRLEQVHVSHLHDPDQPLLLKFSISARLGHLFTDRKVSFTTVLTGSGQATVKY